MNAENLDRRNFLKTCAFTTGVVGLSLEEKTLLAQQAKAKDSGSTDNSAGASKPPTASIALPMGRIGKLKISRLICGGNLINGYAHARDMIYISSLLKHYFTDEKIMETWELCEQCGINTMISTIDDPYAGGNDPTGRTIKRYWDERGGQIQWLAQYFPRPNDPFAKLQMAIDAGAHGAFIQGEMGDRLTQQNRLDLVAKVVEHAKKNGLIAGVACHSIEVPIACEKAGIPVDFYMKTLHSRNYWSATPKRRKAPTTCPRTTTCGAWSRSGPSRSWGPARSPGSPTRSWPPARFSRRTASSTPSKTRLDFACVGMLDFQVRENAVIANTILTDLTRPRPWRG